MVPVRVFVSASRRWFCSFLVIIRHLIVKNCQRNGFKVTGKNGVCFILFLTKIMWIMRKRSAILTKIMWITRKRSTILTRLDILTSLFNTAELVNTAKLVNMAELVNTAELINTAEVSMTAQESSLPNDERLRSVHLQETLRGSPHVQWRPCSRVWRRQSGQTF